MGILEDIIDLTEITKLPSSFVTADKEIVKYKIKQGQPISQNLVRGSVFLVTQKTRDKRGILIPQPHTQVGKFSINNYSQQELIDQNLEYMYPKQKTAACIIHCLRTMEKDEESWFKIPSSSLQLFKNSIIEPNSFSTSKNNVTASSNPTDNQMQEIAPSIFQSNSDFSSSSSDIYFL